MGQRAVDEVGDQLFDDGVVAVVGRTPVGLPAAHHRVMTHPTLAPEPDSDADTTFRGEFADILDSPDGVVAQLWVVARLLKRIKN